MLWETDRTRPQRRPRVSKKKRVLSFVEGEPKESRGLVLIPVNVSQRKWKDSEDSKLKKIIGGGYRGGRVMVDDPLKEGGDVGKTSRGDLSSEKKSENARETVSVRIASEERGERNVSEMGTGRKITS